MSLSFDFPKTRDELELENLCPENITTQAWNLLQECIDGYFDSRLVFAKDVGDELLHYTWEKLNTGNWKDVNITWRKLYSYASLIKAASLCAMMVECHDESQRDELDVPKAALEACDMGLLMGAPILDNILSRLASSLQSYLVQRDADVKGAKDDGIGMKRSGSDIGGTLNHPMKKPKTAMPIIDPDLAIPTCSCPPLFQFKAQYMDKKRPVIIQDAMDHWPARTHRQWSLDYLKKIAGSRTVPIEIGSKYTDENWSQALMKLTDFIDRYISEQNADAGHKGYLAQHQLFDQIPELQHDICIPDYCCLKNATTDLQGGDSPSRSKPCDDKEDSYTKTPGQDRTAAKETGIKKGGDTNVKDSDDEDVDINAWFGPAGTVSPLHHDPKHNCLAQVVGEKYIRLYSEEMTKFVYPHESYLLKNTSQVNVENPDDSRFPLFKQAKYEECILKPGEMLYIPPRCWHYVRSLSTSFSVSFWWR